jgi:hypothetical protein
MAELSAQGGILHSGATSIVDTTQVGKLGRRGIDVDGNEYVYCSFAAAVNAGEFVCFDHAYAAARLNVATQRGWVGIVDGTTSGTTYAWVMVRGVHTAAFVSCLATSAMQLFVGAGTSEIGAPQASSSDSGAVIEGLRITGDPDTCASTLIGTSATFGVITAILNYPWVNGVKDISS